MLRAYAEANSRGRITAMRRFYTIPEVAEAFATSEAQFEAATFAAKALELA